MSLFTSPSNVSSIDLASVTLTGTKAQFNTACSDGDFAFLNAANIFTTNGALSVPAATFNGTWITGGTATTTKPYFLLETTGAASTNWSTSGTGFGINAASGFAGRLSDMQVAAVSKLRILSDGAVFTAQGIYCETTLGSGTRAFAIENNSGDTRLYMTNGGSVRFSSTTDATSSNDAFVTRAAAGVVGLTGLCGDTEAITGASACSVAVMTTKVTTTGVLDALTLANGVNGQFKTIIHDVDGGSFVLTPATKTGFTTITSTNAGESALLQFVTTRGWIILALNGAIAA